jgi:DNA primase
MIVVEGYIDVIALDQFGLGPAVATMGTAATTENMRQLTRLSDRVVFCFDGDRAGRDAAWRAVEAILPFGGGKVAIEFLMLPDGEDPDSFVRARGADAFETLLGNATPLSTFMVRQASHGLDLNSADGRARLITMLKPLIKRLTAGHYRELVIAELAEAVNMPSERVAADIDREATAAPARAAQPDGTSQRSAMRRVLTFILHHPDTVAATDPIAGLDELRVPGAELLRQMLEIARSEPQIKTGEFVERFRQDDEQNWVRRLAAAEPEPLDDASEGPKFLRESLEQLLARQSRSAQIEALRRRAGPPTPA